MSEWQHVTVEELAAAEPNAMATGPFGSSISSKFFVDEGVPVIRGSNLSEKVGTRLDESKLAFVTEEKAQELARSIARRGDLIFTCWGTIGQVGLIDERSQYEEYIVSNKQMKLTPDPDKADSLFLYTTSSQGPLSLAAFAVRPSAAACLASTSGSSRRSLSASRLLESNVASQTSSGRWMTR